MPKLVKELKDIDVRRKSHRLNSSGRPVPAFHSVGGVSGLQLRCGPPEGSNKRGPRSWVLRISVAGNQGTDSESKQLKKISLGIFLSVLLFLLALWRFNHLGGRPIEINQFSQLNKLEIHIGF